MFQESKFPTLAEAARNNFTRAPDEAWTDATAPTSTSSDSDMNLKMLLRTRGGTTLGGGGLVMAPKKNKKKKKKKKKANSDGDIPPPPPQPVSRKPKKSKEVMLSGVFDSLLSKEIERKERQQANNLTQPQHAASQEATTSYKMVIDRARSTKDQNRKKDRVTVSINPASEGLAHGRRGKERLTEKKRKPTRMKRIIIPERSLRVLSTAVEGLQIIEALVRKEQQLQRARSHSSQTDATGNNIITIATRNQVIRKSRRYGCLGGLDLTLPPSWDLVRQTVSTAVNKLTQDTKVKDRRTTLRKLNRILDSLPTVEESAPLPQSTQQHQPQSPKQSNSTTADTSPSPINTTTTTTGSPPATPGSAEGNTEAAGVAKEKDLTIDLEHINIVAKNLQELNIKIEVSRWQRDEYNYVLDTIQKELTLITQLRRHRELQQVLETEADPPTVDRMQFIRDLADKKGALQGVCALPEFLVLDGGLLWFKARDHLQTEIAQLEREREAVGLLSPKKENSTSQRSNDQQLADDDTPSLPSPLSPPPTAIITHVPAVLNEDGSSKDDDNKTKDHQPGHANDAENTINQILEIQSVGDESQQHKEGEGMHSHDGDAAQQQQQQEEEEGQQQPPYTSGNGSRSEISSPPHGQPMTTSSDDDSGSDNDLKPGGATASYGKHPFGVLVDQREHIQTISIHERPVVREYVNSLITDEMVSLSTSMLGALQTFQYRLKRENKLKFKSKMRYVVGLRQTMKGLLAKRVIMVLMANNIEKIATQGGLDDTINSLLKESLSATVPVLFCLNKRKLGAAVKVRQASCIGVYSADGANQDFKKLAECAERASWDYERVEGDREELMAKVYAQDAERQQTSKKGKQKAKQNKTVGIQN